MLFRIIIVIALVLVAQAGPLYAETVLLADQFDDGVLDAAMWTVLSGTPTETGTLVVGDNDGDSIRSIASCDGLVWSFALRNIYDTRNHGDYSRYALGYAGLTNALLLRNDNQGGGQLAVQSWANTMWHTLATITIGDYSITTWTRCLSFCRTVRYGFRSTTWYRRYGRADDHQ